MAEGPIVDLVEENLNKLFYDIRVDHLNEDELDFELEVRDIVFGRDDSMSRKRRALREKLKKEKDEQDGGDRIIKRNPEEEFRICERKVREFEMTLEGATRDLPSRCQSILLHIGNRLRLLRPYVDLETNMKVDNIQQKILAFLNKYFYNKRQDRSQYSTEIGIDNLFEEPSRLNPGRSTSSEVPLRETQTSQGSAISAEVDILGSLRRLGLLESESTDPDEVRNGLLRLENELYLLRHRSGVQTHPSNTVNHVSTTYTGTIPKITVHGSFTSGNQARVTEPVPITQWTQFTNNSCFNSAIGRSINSYVSFPTIMSTVTIPTISNTFPKVASTVSANTYHNLFPPTAAGPLPTSWYSESNSSKADHPGYRPFPLGDEWKLTPWVSNTGSTNPVIQPPLVVPVQNTNWPLPSGGTQALPRTQTSESPSVYAGAMHGLNQQNYPNQPILNPPVGATVGFNTPQPSHVHHLGPANNSFHRKSLPVSKWKLEKYAGTDQGLKLNEFLYLVSQLALSEHVSEAELFDAAFHLFTGPALNWYMSNRSAGRLLNWAHLVQELRRTFAHPELDSLVRARIYQRRQQRSETFQDFFYDMDSMFRSMMNPMSDLERLDVLRRNMRTDYKKALLWKPVTSLAELLDAGHQIDASNFSLFAKVFGTEKSVNIVSSGTTNRDGAKNYGRSQFNSRPQDKNLPKDKEGNTKKKEGGHKTEDRPSQNSARESKEENSGEGPSKPSRTLQYLVEGYKPPRRNECLYCRQTNHSLEQCRNYRGLICLVCGFKGFEAQHCPYCKKNGLQTVESRRPSNPNNDA